MVVLVATTETDIANLALSRVRANPIGSLLEQSVQAEQCRILYPNARNEVLSMVHWPFNKKTVQLSLKTDKPAEWTYAYAYPNDCLMVRYLLPEKNGLVNNYRSVDSRFVSYERDEIEYMVELNGDDEQIIATNQPNAMAVYSKLVKDVRLYGPLVVNVIAWRLAADLATPLGGDAGARYKRDALGSFEMLKSQAEAMYLNQSKPRQKQKLPRSVAARTGRSGVMHRS